MSRVVILESCQNCGDCVEVCPMQCFHDATNYMVINIDECIDCALCEDSCSNSAITNQKYNQEIFERYAFKNQELAHTFPKAF